MKIGSGKSHGFIAIVLLAATACAGQTVIAPAAAEETLPALARTMDLGRPYIGGGLPGAERLVPPMPKVGSPVRARDAAANKAVLADSGNPRWDLAERDANLTTGWFGDAFSCTAGREISEEVTPALANLIRRSATDFGMSTSAVKDIYKRPRPFIGNGQPTCTPSDEAALRSNGSYPSGHSAIGYGIGLVLASVFPDHAAALTLRGREYGDSRALCNVHWMSDVEEGRMVGAAAYARLTNDEGFMADLAAAKAEIALIQAVAVAPEKCAVESAALGR